MPTSTGTLSNDEHIVRGGSLTAMSSKLGYLLSSPLLVRQPQCCHCTLVNIVENHDAEEHDLLEFWTAENAEVIANNPHKKFLLRYSEMQNTGQEEAKIKW